MPGLRWVRRDLHVCFCLMAPGATLLKIKKTSSVYTARAHFETWAIVKHGARWMLMCAVTKDAADRLDHMLETTLVTYLKPDPLTLSVPIEQATRWILNHPTKLSTFYTQHRSDTPP